MPLLLGGSIGIFFVALNFAQLKVTVPLALSTQEGGNKGSNLQVLFESDIILFWGKYSVLGNFLGQSTFSKIVPLLYKRAKLHLSSTNTLLRPAQIFV